MTASPVSGGPARDLPLFPMTEIPDERTEGVVLLEHDEECKTTAEPLEHSWRITDWEVEDFDGAPHWFARHWVCIPKAHIAMLATREGATHEG